MMEISICKCVCLYQEAKDDSKSQDTLIQGEDANLKSAWQPYCTFPGQLP